MAQETQEAQIKVYRIRLPVTTLSISVEPASPGGDACVVIRCTASAEEPAAAPELELRSPPQLRVIAGGRSG
jgi:hypothetical protein